MKNNLFGVLGLIGLSTLVGCGEDSNNAVTTIPTAHLEVTLPASSVRALAPFTFTVAALDATNSVVPTYVGTVQISTSDTSASLPASAHLTRGRGKFTVAFATIGTYSILASDTAGNAIPGSSTVTVNSGPVGVSIVPAATVLTPGGQQAFAGIVSTSGDGTTDLDVTWKVQEGLDGGSITAEGLYTSPASPGIYHVVATSVANPAGSATATVTVIAAGVATTITGSMSSVRGAYTATLLPNGMVMVAGGNSAPPPSGTGNIRGTSAAELYNPATGTFAPTGAMHSPRYAHTATLLPNGKVLVAGGLGDGVSKPPPVLRSAELYDPATDTFTPTGSMLTPRANHTATLISGGRVLIVGGIPDITGEPTGLPPSDGQYPYSGYGSNTAELYDMATGKFTLTGGMSDYRFGQTATLLSDGSVLITGGIQTTNDGDFGGFSMLDTTELYLTGLGTFRSSGTMQSRRNLHAATLLSNGKVLITGGNSDAASAEIFDPLTETFSPTVSMVLSRSAHTATLLNNGLVLVAGGATNLQCIEFNPCGITAILEMFDPATATFTPFGSMHVAHSAHTATLFPNGELLIAGGEGEASAELYP